MKLRAWFVILGLVGGMTALGEVEGEIKIAGRVAASAGDIKIACVNMDRVFQDFYKTIEADAAFQKQKKLYRQRAQELADEIEAIKRQRDQLQEEALNIALSDDVREKKRKQAMEKDALYRERRKELKEFIRDKDRELAKQYLDLRNQLVKEITEFIQRFAKQNGYDFVIDSSGQTRNFIPVLVYYRDDADLTDAVLTELNRGHEDVVEKARKEREAKKKETGGEAPAATEGLKEELTPAGGKK